VIFYVSVYLPDVLLDLSAAVKILKIKKEALALTGAQNAKELALIFGWCGFSRRNSL
jgi:hypothetical protein